MAAGGQSGQRYQAVTIGLRRPGITQMADGHVVQGLTQQGTLNDKASRPGRGQIVRINLIQIGGFTRGDRNITDQ